MVSEDDFKKLVEQIESMGSSIQKDAYFNTSKDKVGKFKQFFNEQVIKKTKREYLQYYEQ